MHGTDLIDSRYHVVEGYTIYINVNKFTTNLWMSSCKVPVILVRF